MLSNEKGNFFYEELKNNFFCINSFKKFFSPKNYGFILPGDSYKDRIFYNLKKHHIPYILFYLTGFFILSIRYMYCLPVAAGLVAYCVFKENIDSHITVGSLAINSFHILLSVVLFSLIYIIVFPSVLFTILTYSLCFCAVAILDFTFFRELNEELNGI